MPDLKGTETGMEVCNQKRKSNRLRRNETQGRGEGKRRITSGLVDAILLLRHPVGKIRLAPRASGGAAKSWSTHPVL